MARNFAQGYEKVRMQTLSGKEIEAAVLEKAANNFRRAQKNMTPGRMNSEVDEALEFNKKIWDVLRADWQKEDSHLNKEMRQNLLSLSVFMTKHGLEFRSDPQPEKLNILIQINENLVSGLRTKRAAGTEPEKEHSPLNLKA